MACYDLWLPVVPLIVFLFLGFIGLLIILAVFIVPSLIFSVGEFLLFFAFSPFNLIFLLLSLYFFLFVSPANITLGLVFLGLAIFFPSVGLYFLLRSQWVNASLSQGSTVSMPGVTGATPMPIMAGPLKGHTHGAFATEKRVKLFQPMEIPPPPMKNTSKEHRT